MSRCLVCGDKISGPIIYQKSCDICKEVENVLSMCYRCYIKNERHYECLRCKRNNKIKEVLGE